MKAVHAKAEAIRNEYRTSNEVGTDDGYTYVKSSSNSSKATIYSGDKSTTTKKSNGYTPKETISNDEWEEASTIGNEVTSEIKSSSVGSALIVTEVKNTNIAKVNESSNSTLSDYLQRFEKSWDPLKPLPRWPLWDVLKFNEGTSNDVETSNTISLTLSQANPDWGTPGSVVDLLNPDGSVKQRRRYGPNGRPLKDRDFKHPGEDHKFPHDHDWIWDGDKFVDREDGVPVEPDAEFIMLSYFDVLKVTALISFEIEKSKLEQQIDNISEATGLTGTGLVIYTIISEASRLYPPRNLIPLP